VSLLCAFGVGCASSATQVELTLRPAADANGSRSVYVLARAIDEKSFGTESYEAVAARVTAPDTSVQEAVVVLPGQSRMVTLEEPEKGSLAIYVLLEHPESDGWRLLLPSPAPKKFEIRIERSRICRTAKAGEACPAREH